MTHQVEFRGVPFQIVEGTTHPGYSLGCFQPGGEEYDFREAHWNVKPGDVVVDAGASYGAYSIAALSAGAAKVWAFEPELTVHSDLVANIAVNGWRDKAVAFPYALWDRNEPVNMHGYAPHWPPQTITGPYNGRPLDEMVDIQDGDRLDWIKVDTEGSEVRVIRGALKTIERFRPRLIVEAHTFLDPELADKCKALLPGYTWQDVPRGDVVMLIGECR